MAKNWRCVAVEARSDIVEELASEVATQFQRGIELTDTGFRVYLEEGIPDDIWRPLLQSAIRAAQDRSTKPFPPPIITVSLVPEEEWAATWKVHFKPLRVGKRLLVCPTWEEPKPTATDIVLRIDPGRAFGTGHHETTRLCLEWLEDFREHGSTHASPTLLDVGTGSGILAMAGVLLGFESAIGIDNDPEAVDVATENLQTNGLERNVRLVVGGLKDISEPSDVVIANIQADPLVSLADDLIRHVRSGGRLVLSGILVNQKDSVRRVFESKGMTLLELRIDGEWCLLAFSNQP